MLSSASSALSRSSRLEILGYIEAHASCACASILLLLLGVEEEQEVGLVLGSF